jgi:predicted transcriptional regulator
MRTLVDIPESDLERLDALARKHKRSRAAEIRAAITKHLHTTTDSDWIDAAFGLWGDRAQDGLSYQERVRAEWERDLA